MANPDRTTADCSVTGCERAVLAKGWCSAHYQRVRRNGGGPGRASIGPDPRPARRCSIGGCENKYRSLGFCEAHYMRARRNGGDPGRVAVQTRLIGASLRERFEAKLDPLRLRTPDACWPFRGTISRYGYGQIQRAHGSPQFVRAHRAAYELYVGPIPEGLSLDHVCHSEDQECLGGNSCPHRRCCNPSHLEPVTFAENTMRGRGPMAENARKTHCPFGHLLSGENLYVPPGRGGKVGRACRICARDRRRRYKPTTKPKEDPTP